MSNLPENTRYLDAIFPDLNGIFRGKRMPIDQADKVLCGELRMPRGVYVLSAVGTNDDACGIGFSDGDPDRKLIADPNSLVPVPWLEGDIAQVLVRHVEDDGEPLWLDPRTVLEGVLAKFAAAKLTPVIAVELEFYLLDGQRDHGSAPEPPVSHLSARRERSTQVYSVDQLSENQAIFDDVYAAAALQGIPVTALTAEYSPGQYEVNLKHSADVLQACTDAALLKRVIQGVARKHNVAASFAAKPYLAESGSGMHIHVSLLDEAGSNLFADSETKLKQAIGGLFELWAEAQLIYAPNINSYRRFRPDSYAPFAKNWGFENRLAAARVPGGSDHARRIEWRTPGADANPYLVVAATLASLLYGIQHKCDPGPELSGPPELKQAEDVPFEQYAAFEAMAKGSKLAEFIEPRYLELYTETKRAERREFENEISAREYDWFLMDHA